MKTGNRVVDEKLADASSKWRWLRFLQHTGTLGSLFTLLFLALGCSMINGWLTKPVLAGILVAFFVAAAFFAWIGAAIAVLSKDTDRGWLAGLLERGQPKLLDRVNTLVALENQRSLPQIKPFYKRIAQQAQLILKKEPAPSPFSAGRAVAHLAIFLVLLIATIEVYDKYSPWERMKAARLARQAPAQRAATQPDSTLEIAPPQENNLEHGQTWGEVRITDPARDLQVTKVDVVPMQIEAAANEPLHQVAWLSTINGAAEQPHELPPPPDPKYAVYQPTLYLDELKLADWDVLTYYAKAGTRDTNSFASEVYFLEVRPFREDILKTPGGEDGKAMQCINELSSLIAQQQHVIRQTHQHVQNPPAETRLQEQDRDKLAAAEEDLSQGAEHLYARMASEMENKPIGQALDHLAQAGKSLERAGQHLRDDVIPEAQAQERSGLADLVAARKAFQKVVSENPQAFEEPKDEPPPTADPKDKLREIAEFRNEEKAAQDFLQKLAQKQSLLERRVGPTLHTNAAKLAAEEKQLQQSFEEFQQQHPKVFKPVQPEAKAAGQCLNQAASALEKKASNARAEVRQATEKLQNLAKAMLGKSAERQLTDAYKLKQVLDQQIEKFGQCQNPGAGGGLSYEQTLQAVGETRQALDQLKTLAERQPTRDAFGPGLREALGDLQMTELHWPLSQLEKPLLPDAKQKAAGQAKEELEKVSQAFEASEPKPIQVAKQSAQAGEPKGGFEKGLAQLDSLIKQLENKRSVPREDQAKQGREAFYNLQNSLRESQGSNERGNQVLLRLEKELKSGESPPDVENLKKLMDELQHFSVEMLARQDRKEEKPEVTAIDPSRLPPAYRGRIEKYFQKLSER